MSAARYPCRGDISAPFIGIEEWILEQCLGAERSQGVLGKDLYGGSLYQEVKCRHYRKHVLTFTVRANYPINVHVETAVGRGGEGEEGGDRGGGGEGRGREEIGEGRVPERWGREGRGEGMGQGREYSNC